MNRVIDHIREHLAEPLTLGELARVAAFSPFHFDRVFKAVAGETLFGFVQRVRVDRAASALLARHDASVLEIALDHGFASAATFARAFRARFGMSAVAAWLPGSGYQPDDRPCDELYRGDPTVDRAKQSFRCDLCLPVRPL